MGGATRAELLAWRTGTPKFPVGGPESAANRAEPVAHNRRENGSVARAPKNPTASECRLAPDAAVHHSGSRHHLQDRLGFMRATAREHIQRNLDLLFTDCVGYPKDIGIIPHSTGVMGKNVREVLP